MLRTFCAALPRGSEAEPDDLRLASVLEARLEEVGEVWPQLSHLVSAFVPHLAAKVPEGEIACAWLERARITDLFLAFASGTGEPAAIRAFDARHRDVLGRLTAQFPNAGVSADDVKQLVEEHLLVAGVGAGARARILDYRGEGQLESFVRVTATRLLMGLASARKNVTPLEDDILDALVDTAESAEATLLKQTYRLELKGAFAEAVECLSDRERNFLRYSLCDHLPLEAIGTMYGVHKSNVSRALAVARDKLDAALREAFRRRVAVSASEYESIVRLVMSQLELSLARCLAPAPRD